MPFFDFFRDFFGSHRRRDPTHDRPENFGEFGDSFRNPIWQNDDDEDDEEDFRRVGPGIHFGVFTDPMEITRYFESEMDNILKLFFNFHGFGHHNIPSIEDGSERALPDAGQWKKESPRDEVLKPRYKSPSPKVDEALDGVISADNFAKAWEDSNASTGDSLLKDQDLVPFNETPFTQSFGKSVRTEIVRKADGSIERKQITRNSDGSEEVTISKEMGDKKYIVTTKKDSNGVETKTEDLVNMNENELKDFEQKWTSQKQPEITQRSSILNQIPWEDFFGPNPKL